MESDEQSYKDKYLKLKAKYKALQVEYNKAAGSLDGLTKTAKSLNREKNFLSEKIT